MSRSFAVMKIRAFAASVLWVSVAYVGHAFADEPAAVSPPDAAPTPAPGAAETPSTQAPADAPLPSETQPAALPVASPPEPAALPVAPPPEPAALPAAPAASPIVLGALVGPDYEKPMGSKSAEQGVLGPFRAGLLAGIGAPSALSAQLLGTYKGWVGLAADVGMLPTVSLPIGEGVSIRQSQMSLGARVYPFHGMFFVGAGIGGSTLSARASATQQGATGQLSMSANTVFVMPQLGLLHRFSFGLAVGMDVGLQLPLSGSSSTGATVQGMAVDAPAGVRDAVAYAEKRPIPVLNLLRIGYVL